MGTGIYNIVKAKITIEDLGTFKAQAKKREVLIVEKYANSEAFMTHLKKFMQAEYIPTMLTMQEIISVEMPGTITKEMEQLFAEGGWSYNAYPLDV